MDLVCDHECGIESESEMSYDLVGTALILVLFDEIGSAGKCDLGYILFDLISGHSESVIGYGNGLGSGIDLYAYSALEAFGKLILAHHVELLELGNGITSVRNQLTIENIVVRIHPFLDYREYIFAVYRKISHFFVHNIRLLKRGNIRRISSTKTILGPHPRKVNKKLALKSKEC